MVGEDARRTSRPKIVLPKRGFSVLSDSSESFEVSQLLEFWGKYPSSAAIKATMHNALGLYSHDVYHRAIVNAGKIAALTVHTRLIMGHLSAIGHHEKVYNIYGFKTVINDDIAVLSYSPDARGAGLRSKLHYIVTPTEAQAIEDLLQNSRAKQ